MQASKYLTLVVAAAFLLCGQTVVHSVVHETDKLVDSTPVDYDFFGNSVDVYGDLAVVW